MRCFTWLSRWDRNCAEIDAVARERPARVLRVHPIGRSLRFAGSGEDCTWIVFQGFVAFSPLRT
jgi:hypothetical protein